MEKVEESPVRLAKKKNEALEGMFGGNVTSILEACNTYRSEKKENKKVSNVSKGRESVDIKRLKALLAAGVIALGLSTGAIVDHLAPTPEVVPEWYDPNAHLDLLSEKEDFLSHVKIADNYSITGEVYYNSDADNYVYTINEPVEGFLSQIAIITSGVNDVNHIFDLYRTKIGEEGQVIVERFNDGSSYPAHDIRTMLLENGLDFEEVERVMGYFDGIGWVEVNENNFQKLFNDVLAQRETLLSENNEKVI